MMKKGKIIVSIVLGLVTIVAGSRAFVPACGNVYAEVGSIEDGEDVTYDKTGGVLSSIGFDTSEVPDTYDADATTNPYGSDVSNKDEVREGLWFDLHMGSGKSFLYGHNKKLNGAYSDFIDSPIEKSIYDGDKHRFGAGTFLDAVKLDLYGDGRDSAVAIVYTHFLSNNTDSDANIYMCLYDPANGSFSDPFVISSLRDGNTDRVTYNYLVQSQLQITAGDYDKDSVDEIAVYSPGKNESDKNKIMFFDLKEGKECDDPFSKDAWNYSWNYMLPNYSEKIVNISNDKNQETLTSNLYNNIDLTSGDADNDGVCDLIVSYGASDTDYAKVIAGSEASIKRSIPSKSVLLYGSDTGQMLRDSQMISYAGNSLIRVSFAFGDVDGDGNEDMFIAGQAQSEQSDNLTRVIGKYVYDKGSDQMSPETLQDLKVIDGSWSDDHSSFYSSNGWDGYYYSVPLMKTNLAIGNIMGSDSNTKIYLDSVLYSYDDGNYSIVDELEDTSKDGDKYKGSCVFAGNKAMKGYYDNENAVSTYYEFGADCGNFTASPSDYLIINRVSTVKATMTGETESTSSFIYCNTDSKERNLIRKDPLHDSGDYTGYTVFSMRVGPAVQAASVDTDKDGLVAEYTGEHEITYQDPAILAVLASPPYFKDVAAYDENDLLVYLKTEYGTSSGEVNAYEETFECKLGVFFNTKIGTKALHAVVGGGAGWAREETWGWEKEREFEVSYETEGGEDAVVLYSIPTENYKYKVRGVTVDDDGNYQEFTNTMIVAKPHKPVTQTLALEDYEEIQKRYPDKLPDVGQYLTSVPGDPSSYPSSTDDIPKAAKEHLDKSKDHPIDCGESWAGVAFGDGSITQKLTYTKETRERYDNVLNGIYGKLEVGVGSDAEILFFYEGAEAGISFDDSRLWGNTKATLEGSDCAGTIKNMPRSAKGYGYNFSWKILKYNVKDKGCEFPVVTYLVTDVSMPPELPETIEQDFDNTTDSQIALTWTYSKGNPLGFDIYRYEDFPVGGGDKLIATVDGSDYKIMKDKDGNTLRDKDGHVVRGYTFIDTDLTADTKYNYRIKVRTAKLPGESIFSPIIEARTDVGTKPNLSLSTDKLTVYPDSTYNIKVQLADPENYQKEISYQWQKYDEKKRKWEDVEGCAKQILHFYNCNGKEAGTYRCRVNLIRKVEGRPQYISTFTESCKVSYSLRNVKFDKIQVFKGKGNSKTNTGLSVRLTNTSSSSLEKPTGMVTFDIVGPNGTIHVGGIIDEETGEVTINSIEDLIEDGAQTMFVDGGYLITAYYEGSKIFNPAKSDEEYHYLRNIEECLFLSTRSSYYFGEDISETYGLYDYKIGSSGNVTREDYTDRITCVKFYEVDDSGKNKTGDAVAEFEIENKQSVAKVPLNKKLAGRAYVEVYMDGSNEPAASNVIKTRKNSIQISIKDKITGTGNLMEFLTSEDLEFSYNLDPNEKNIETDDGNKSLADFLEFNYYEQNGDFICTSDDISEHLDDFIPASYYATIQLKADEEKGDDASWFYTPSYSAGRITVVGNYYLVTALPKDKSTGSVRMLSPDNKKDFEKVGYVGGTRLILKAEPNPGYEISKWIVDDCGTKTITYGSEKLTYTVRSQNNDGNGEIKITAEMQPKGSKLKIDNIGSGEVTSVPEIKETDTILAGTKIKLTATPYTGWHFVEWRWTTLGGNNTVSGGTPNGDGSNTKEYTMPESSAEVYALFAKDTVDIDAAGGLEVLYKNNGENPYYEDGEMVLTEKGKAVPKGTEVTVRTKQGMELDPDSEWEVLVKNETGEVPVTVNETMSQGRKACSFVLPEDATFCKVSVGTTEGNYSVVAETEGVDFTIFVDGQEMNGNSVEGISSGSQVDIKARVHDRGARINSWIINGEAKESKDTIYTFNIKENMSFAVTTEAVEGYLMKISAKGGGILKYVITDSEGDELSTGSVERETLQCSVYTGENVYFTTSDDDDTYTMTSISLDGEKQTIVDGGFTVSDISGNIEVEARFSPNAYFTAKFNKEFRDERSKLFDGDGNEIADEEDLTVPKNKQLRFSLLVPEENYYDVIVDGQSIECESETVDQDGKKVYFKIDKVVSDTNIVVKDYETVYISSSKDMRDYLNKLAATSRMDQPYDQPDGVLLKDIDMSEKLTFPIFDMYAKFDGNGHVISNICVGREYGRQGSFYGLFEVIHEGAGIKNVTFDGITVFANDNEHAYYGLLSYKNNGTISNVSVINSRIDLKLSSDDMLRVIGVITSSNEGKGKVEHCMASRNYVASNISINKTQLTGVVWNHDETASMTGNYFEYMYSEGSDAEAPVLRDAEIVVYHNDEWNNGVFDSNYYLQTYDTEDKFGTNAFDLTDNPSDREAAEVEVQTAEFSRKLAYTINKDLGKDVWGVTGNEEYCKGIYPIAGNEKYYFAPIKVEYVSGMERITRYMVPGEVTLPGAELFGENTPVAWEIDKQAYRPGEKVYIHCDMRINGITDTSGYQARLVEFSDENTGLSVVYYKDANDAFSAAANADPKYKELIHILNDAVLSGNTLDISYNTGVNVNADVTLKISNKLQINNKGSINFEPGATVHKYGSILNEGDININEGVKFYNYGSTFANKGDGVTEGQDRITCKPHIFDKWVYADEPDDEGKWNRSSKCAVCGCEVTEEVLPDPSADKIKDIVITSVPEKTLFDIGEPFEDTGLKIIANLLDGTKAPITIYSLSIKLGDDDEKPIENGDVLSDEGVGKIIVDYKGFNVDYDVRVIDKDKHKEHVWDEGKVTKEATYDEEGEMLYTCTVCGETKTEVIPKLEPTTEPTTEPDIKPDQKDAKFMPLMVKSTKQTKTSVTLTWKKNSDAAKYVIYANRNGKRFKLTKAAEVTGNTKKLTKIAGKKLKKGTAYKFMVIALDKGGNKIATSSEIRVYTKGGKFTNYKAVKVQVKKGSKYKAVKGIALKKGKTRRLRGVGIKASKKLKYKALLKIRYESSNPKIATVTSKGVVKGKQKGTCKIYVYAPDGVCKTIKVTVK